MTQAYQGSVEPPSQLRFGDNVIVQLAYGGLMNKFLPLGDPENKELVDLVRAWTKVVPTLYVWAPSVNFENTLLPIGNYFTQPEQIKGLVNLSIKGYYAEGSPHPGVDMIELKTYVTARTAFNPTLDTDELISEFLEH